MDELLALARATAARAADLVQQMRAQAIEIAETKSSATDVVTRADLASQQLIREALLSARPEDGFLGEEGGDVVSRSGVTWVVDPIDGTVNYLYRLPYFAVSIAAQVDGQSVVGVVNAPALGREYWAERGKGSYRNGQRLQCGESSDLATALVATGFGYESAIRRQQATAVAAMLPQVRDIRRMGACALDICGVAEGSLDAYAESGPHLWDHAAASLIAREAGASFALTSSDTGRDLLLCASSGLGESFAALATQCGF